MKCAQHIATALVAVLVLLGAPIAAFADIDAIGAKLAGVDTVSSATAIQEAPSGTFLIIVNREKHPNPEVLDDWVTFFSGEGAPLIMEDVDCIAFAEDPAGIDMAESLQSRLPENQMDLHVESATLALSKADEGMFDVLVMSSEAADLYGAQSVIDLQDTVVIER